jgi:hypothetical protein
MPTSTTCCAATGSPRSNDMAITKLYRIAEGTLTEFAAPDAAVEPGRYDEQNWATDWILVRAMDATTARRISRKYDRRVTGGQIGRPRYLRPIGRFYVGETK